MKRKDLLKIALGVIALAAAGLSSVNFAFSRHGVVQDTHMPGAEKMIGCLTGDIDLEKTLENIDDKRVLNITFIPAFDKDIIKHTCSAFVIDRRLIGKDAWNEYADFFKESGNDTPLLIVDHIRDWIIPQKGGFS